MATIVHAAGSSPVEDYTATGDGKSGTVLCDGFVDIGSLRLEKVSYRRDAYPAVRGLS